MFVLSEMKDVIRVTPEYFHQSLTESITTLLNRKLANKVNIILIPNLFNQKPTPLFRSTSKLYLKIMSSEYMCRDVYLLNDWPT